MQSDTDDDRRPVATPKVGVADGTAESDRDLRSPKSHLRAGSGHGGGDGTSGGMHIALLPPGFLSPVLHTVHHSTGSSGQSPVVRGLPQDASEAAQFQLLSRGPVHCRLWIPGVSASGLAQQHSRMAGVQQGRLVRDLGIR